jgi:hypothetical protein
LIEQLGAGATASAINAVCFGVFAEDRRSKPTDDFADFCMRMLLRHVPVCAGVSGCVVGNYSILAAIEAEAALEDSTVECVANPHLSNTINRANGIVPPDTAKRLMDCTVFELKDSGGFWQHFVVSPQAAQLFSCFRKVHHEREYAELKTVLADAQVLYMLRGQLQTEYATLAHVSELHTGDDAAVNARLQRIGLRINVPTDALPPPTPAYANGDVLCYVAKSKDLERTGSRSLL